MSERIDVNNIKPFDLRFKRWSHQHTAGTDDFAVDVHKLHKLTENIPVEKIPIENFEDQLDVECWSIDDNDTPEGAFAISPRDILDAISKYGLEEARSKFPEYQHHIDKVLLADRSYPVLVYDGFIVDGSHRLTQIYLDKILGTANQNFITVKRLRRIPEEAITKK